MNNLPKSQVLDMLEQHRKAEFAKKCILPDLEDGFEIPEGYQVTGTTLVMQKMEIGQRFKWPHSSTLNAVYSNAYAVGDRSNKKYRVRRAENGDIYVWRIS